MPFRSLSLIFLSTLCLSAQAEEAKSRPFLKSSGQAILDYGSSPARLQSEDLHWLIPSAMATAALLHFDVPLHEALAKGDAREDWLDRSMPFVSAAGEGWYEAAAVITFSYLGDERLNRTSQTAMQVLVTSAVYTAILKPAFWSNRPSQADNGHSFWAYDQQSMGLPSGHSFSAFALAEVYGAEYGRAYSYPFALLMGYSRIYNHAHWPSDVFVGALLGIIAGKQATAATAKDGPPVLFSLKQSDHTPILVAQVTY